MDRPEHPGSTTHQQFHRTSDICKERRMTPLSLGHGEDELRQIIRKSLTQPLACSGYIGLNAFSCKQKKISTHTSLNNKGVDCFIALKTQQAGFRVVVQLSSQVTGALQDVDLMPDFLPLSHKVGVGWGWCFSLNQSLWQVGDELTLLALGLTP